MTAQNRAMRPTPRTVRLAAAGAALTALAALAGCSSDQPTSQPTGQATSQQTGQATSGSTTTATSGPTSQAGTASSTPTGAGTATTGSASPSSPSRGTSSSGTTGRPSAGSTASTVPSRTQQTNKPTKQLLDTTSTVAPKLTAELTSLRSARVNSTNPGEVSGNAVIFGLRVVNGTSSSVDLGNVVVTLAGANGNPGTEITTSPAKPLSGTLAAGTSASGTYVFVVAKDQRDPVTVNVTLSAGTAVAVFHGDAS